MIKSNLRKKIGIIHKINQFSSSALGVLLKIFENLDDTTKVYFSSSIRPHFTIETRSELIFLPPEATEEIIEKAKLIIKHAMQIGKYTKELSDAFKILTHSHSLFKTGLLSEADYKIIVEDLGLKEK